jgi:hypothetical protein
MSDEGPMGFKGRMAVKTGSGAQNWASGASYFEFLGETLTSQNLIDLSQGITGDRSQRSERDRAGPFTHGGWVHLQMCPGDLPLWLQYATGGTPTGSGTISYPLATGLPAFSIIIDKVTDYEGGNANFELIDTQLDTLVVHGQRTAQQGDGPQPPDFITVSAKVFGKTTTTGSATFPTLWALGSTELYRPYEFQDVTFNILSADREIKQFHWQLVNNLFQRRVNNLNPTSIYPTGFRQVALQVRVPHDADNTDLYDRYPDYGQGVLTIANTPYETVFTMPSMRGPRNGPHIIHKGEIDNTYRWMARRVGTGDELTITNKVA